MTSYVDTFNWNFILVTNPDGYVFTWNSVSDAHFKRDGLFTQKTILVHPRKKFEKNPKKIRKNPKRSEKIKEIQKNPQKSPKFEKPEKIQKISKIQKNSKNPKNPKKSQKSQKNKKKTKDFFENLKSLHPLWE